ncbi:hypothetical protein J0S82_014953 [Galemys pyrenaicus]|uniref:Uncharacterized protein n=1 Tax=Galemys pyrenaicus TaxID=202257 RepID=A0A8J6APM9_GALPY|nr:hypothetical protein J0S82_014953 [Galemys pyrenaicus]
MYPQISILTEHQKLQADDQPYGCGESYESSLHSRHQRTLTTEEMFDSKNCVKTLSCKTALTLQPLSQTEMKQFKGLSTTSQTLISTKNLTKKGRTVNLKTVDNFSREYQT